MDMKDAASASSRIYVGNLSDCVDQDALYERFKAYGAILGVKRRPKHNYAFVQFESDASALEAIERENHTTLAGRKLVVNQACAGHAKARPQPAAAAPPTDVAVEPPPEIAPLMETNVGPPSAAAERGRGFRGGRGRGRPGFRDRSPRRVQPAAPRAPDRNDCEIIVVSKTLTDYAEHIEQRLKRIGLTVDVLYPNEDVPIGRVLGNIVSRGTLYAILVMPQNEERLSLTLNILHGLPQEHRNIPLEDALALVARNFAEFRSAGSTAGNEAIVALLHQAAHGRALSVQQYDRILEYVRDRRDKQYKAERGAEPDTTQANLQQRIMSILNSEKPPAPAPSEGPAVVDNAALLREKIATMLNGSAGAPQPVAAPDAPKAGFGANSTIQKALDTILNKLS